MTSGRPLRWTAAAALLLLGFLPIVNWIPGGHEAPWFGERLRESWRDAALVAGIGVLLAILSRRIGGLWRPGWWTPMAGAASARPGRAALVLGVLALAIYAVVAQLVLSGRPLLIDELIQVWQARVLAAGRFWLPSPEFPEFTSAMHLVDFEGRRFGQFPMGGPAMLALGSLVRAEWLVGPAFGAVSVVLAWDLFRRLDGRAGVALGAAILLAVAPFTVFMAGSHMNHVTTLTWLLVAVLGLARTTGSDAPRLRDGFTAGLGLGIAATIRPVDALAFALPAAAWLLHQAWRTRRPGALLASGLGVALPLGLLLATNAATTGDPLVFGYTLMWGSAHDLGFHATPWGEVHTPLRGLELVNLYFLRLQEYLFEAPVPALVPAALALLLTPRLRALDRYLLASAGLLVGLYFAYWHDGFFLGPRFMYPLLPVLAVWTARLLPSLRDRLGDAVAYRAACFGLLAAIPLALVSAGLVRAQQYRNGLLTMRFDADSAARAAGIRDAVILVRESWGAQVVVRMWAVGVSRGESEQFYRRIDTCVLDQALRRIESDGLRGAQAVARLAPLLADSARVESSTLSPDFTERVLPGLAYPPECRARLAEDAGGFTLFAPLLLAGKDGNLFVRDLRERNSLLGETLRGRAVYLLRPPGPQAGLMPQFSRLPTP